MSEFFLKIVNMSIAAGWTVLFVLGLRLILKKAPKWITVLLWAVVALRLICPFSLESSLSLIPSGETISPEIMTDTVPEINSGVPIINYAINPIIENSMAPNPGDSVNPIQVWTFVFAVVWGIGSSVMVLYAVISYLMLLRRLKTATLQYDNVYASKKVRTPFVIGIIKPRIILPYDISSSDAPSVIEHEKTHIRRGDNIIKPIGFLLLCLHWFNPLIWLAYHLFCKDIEFACDESTVRNFSREQKADYSEALLRCSTGKVKFEACPLAFGEVSVKSRIKSVLSYKKPTLWIIIIAVILAAVTAVCFLTNPISRLEDELAVFVDGQICEHNYAKGETDGNFIAISHKLLGRKQSFNKVTLYMWVLYHEYSFENGQIKLEAGSHVPTVITAKRTGKHGHYKLLEYWTPRDGSLYAPDIKEKFPFYLHGKALDSQRYIDEQKAFCDNAAKEYFKADGKNLSWDYMPMTSYTANYCFYFDFDFKYTHLKASCNGGQMWAQDTKGQPYGEKMEYRYGQTVCWTPQEAVIQNLKPETNVQLSFYDGEKEIRSCTVVFKLTDKKDIGTACYNVYLENGSGLELIRTDIGARLSAQGAEVITEEVPALTVTLHSASIRAMRSTISWTYPLESGKQGTVNADGKHPILDNANMPILVMLPTNKGYASPYVAALTFDIVPNEVYISRWNSDEFGNTDAKSENITPQREGDNITLELKNGEYVYEVTATFKGAENCGGTVRYCFSTMRSYIDIKNTFERTDSDKVEATYEKEEFVITKAHHLLENGDWYAEGQTYKYRLELSGKMNGTDKSAAYIVLSNRNDITFDMAWKASGLSSLSTDYFDVSEALIVANKIYN